MLYGPDHCQRGSLRWHVLGGWLGMATLLDNRSLLPSKASNCTTCFRGSCSGKQNGRGGCQLVGLDVGLAAGLLLSRVAVGLLHQMVWVLICGCWLAARSAGKRHKCWLVAPSVG